MDYGLHKKQLCDGLKIGGQTFEKVTYDETLLLVATWEHSLHNPIDTIRSVVIGWLIEGLVIPALIRNVRKMMIEEKS
eukprot:scaffold1698_cov279-Chaetoceros_neogracile.AAC.17